jgi:uncharacterized protein (DUF849 family)
MFLKACLNGSRELGEHPALPITPEELARDAAAVSAAGAQALHIHPRDAAGKQSLTAEDQAAALSAIRQICPGQPVGVSTAFWIEPDVALRLRRVQEWTVLPDFASVNFDEPGVAELCHALLSRGIGVEAGLSHATQVPFLRQLKLDEHCLRILIEPAEEESEAALTTAQSILQALDAEHITLPRLLHGGEATTWPLLETALRLGYGTRTGLEDTLRLPDVSQARGNAELVALAVQKAREHF